MSFELRQSQFRDPDQTAGQHTNGPATLFVRRDEKSPWHVVDGVRSKSIARRLIGQVGLETFLDKNCRLLPNPSDERSGATIGEGCRQQIAKELSIQEDLVPVLIEELQKVFHPWVGSKSDKWAIPAIGSMYRGRNMELGAHGGSWSTILKEHPNTALPIEKRTDWPHGCGDVPFDIQTPMMFNLNGDWNQTGENNWKTNLDRGLRSVGGIIRRCKQRPIALLCDDFYAEFWWSGRGYAKSGCMWHEGLVVLRDSSIPKGKAYVIGSDSFSVNDNGILFNPYKCFEMGSYEPSLEGNQ